MATPFDAKFRALAQGLIVKFGPSQKATYTHILSAGTIDDDTNSVTGDTVDVQVLQTTPLLAVTKDDINLGTITNKDASVYVSGPEWDAVYAGSPKISDQLVLANGDGFKVLMIIPLSSGDQIAAYRLILRRGVNVA